MTKFYIAAKFKARHRIKVQHQRLVDLGLENTCPWFLLDVDDSADDDSLGGYSREEHAEMADRDISAVRETDVFIIDTDDISDTGGREAELGAAIILGKAILHVGPVRNLFHMHPSVLHCLSWDEVIRYITVNYCHDGGK